jgi:hypothetical protein
MARKRRKSKVQSAKRRASQRKRRDSGLRRYGLLIGVVVVAVAVVAVLVVLDQARSGSATQPGQISLDKSKGAADAPVVVIEYGDFQ